MNVNVTTTATLTCIGQTGTPVLLNGTLYRRRGMRCASEVWDGHLKWKQFRPSAATLGFKGRKIKVTELSQQIIQEEMCSARRD